MKNLPTPRKVKLRTIKPDVRHVLLAEHDGKYALLTAISDSCGPDGEFWCEVSAHFLPYTWNLSGRFLDGVDLCEARDEAWLRGKYAPEEN